jgi:hypothetical protein
VTPPHPPASLHHHLSPFTPPSFLFLFVSSSPSIGCSPPFTGSFPPIVASSPPYVEFTGSHGDLRFFEDRGFLMWLVSSFWQMVWGFHPTRALPLERLRSESFIISPPCLRSDHFKHLIVVCPCARIACALRPWFQRFEHPTIRSVEDCFYGLPACHLLIWTTLAADAFIVFLDVCKSFDLDPYVILYVFPCCLCCPSCIFGPFVVSLCCCIS